MIGVVHAGPIVGAVGALLGATLPDAVRLRQPVAEAIPENGFPNAKPESVANARPAEDRCRAASASAAGADAIAGGVVVAPVEEAEARRPAHCCYGAEV